MTSSFRNNKEKWFWILPPALKFLPACRNIASSVVSAGERTNFWTWMACVISIQSTNQRLTDVGLKWEIKMTKYDLVHSSERQSLGTWASRRWCVTCPLRWTSTPRIPTRESVITRTATPHECHPLYSAPSEWQNRKQMTLSFLGNCVSVINRWNLQQKRKAFNSTHYRMSRSTVAG